MEALQRLHNRGSISTGYDIDNSVKLEADNQEEFIRTPSSASNQKTWTVSMWFKRTEINNYQMLFGCLDTYCYFDTSNNLTINFRGASENFFLITNRLFRDTSAWYHIVVVCDFTNSTAADRGRLYINGVRETSYSNSTYQNAHSGVSSSWNSGSAMAVGGQNGSTTFQSCGYMAEVHGVDGSALTADSFGEFDDDSGIWKPKKADVTYGTNGFYFKFDSASDMGNDSSGNNNDFSVVNINQDDQATDTPTNNFCTMNMLNRTDGNSKTQEGGTKLTTDGGSDWCSMVATMGVTKGKWYWETERGTNDVVQGIVGSEDDFIPYSSAAKYYLGNVAERSSMGFYSNANPNMRNGNGMSFDFDAGDILMIGLDMDNSKLYFGVNGTWQGSGDSIGGNTAGASTLWDDFDNEFVLPAVSVYQGGNMKINFGGYTCISISSGASDANGYGTFEHAPPSGYYALCSKNLEEFG